VLLGSSFDGEVCEGSVLDFAAEEHAEFSFVCLCGITLMDATAVLADVVDEAIAFVCFGECVDKCTFAFFGYVDHFVHSSMTSSSMLSLVGVLIAVI
jgi:hypothetical protein